MGAGLGVEMSPTSRQVTTETRGPGLCWRLQSGGCVWPGCVWGFGRLGYCGHSVPTQCTLFSPIPWRDSVADALGDPARSRQPHPGCHAGRPATQTGAIVLLISLMELDQGHLGSSPQHLL